MKSISLLILLLTVTLACKKSSDEIDNPPGIDVTFHVENEYFDTSLKGDLVISNSTGATIETIQLSNNQTFQVNIPSDGADVFLSLVLRKQPDDNFININTFVLNADLVLSVAKNPNLNLDKSKVALDFSNLDIDFQSIVANGLSIGGSSGSLYLEPYVFPADVFAAVKVAGSDIRKFYFQENVDDSFSADIGLDDLTDVLDSVSISYPTSDYFLSDLRAKRSESDDFYYRISSDFGSSPTCQHYLPFAEFNDFLLETSLIQGDIQYYTLEHFNSFDFTYQVPDFDYNIIASSVESIKLDGGEDCNYYSLLFRNFNNPDFNLLWSFHGEFDEDVETFLPNLEPYLQSLHAGYSNQDLDYIHTKGYKVEEPYGYNQFIESKIERYPTMKTQKNKVEYIEKED